MFGLQISSFAACVLATFLWIVPVHRVEAATVVHNFEGLADSEQVSNQIAGLTFSNAQVLTAGISLNEFDFPPASGLNVLFENGTGMRIDFADLLFRVGAYFIYTEGLSFSAFDTAGNVLGSLSRSGQNIGGPGEFLSLDSASGRISYVVIGGAASGFSFVMDDLSVDTGLEVPEPETLTLIGGVLGAGFLPGGWLRRRRRS